MVMHGTAQKQTPCTDDCLSHLAMQSLGGDVGKGGNWITVHGQARRKPSL